FDSSVTYWNLRSFFAIFYTIYQHISEGMPHPLETQYGLTANELLDAINKRFRAKVTLEGAVAEVKAGKIIKSLEEKGLIIRSKEHDRDAYPDYTVWIEGRETGIRIECKNIRDADEAYKKDGKVIAYKVETQKTRASKGDPSSRCYSFDQFEILGVCLGKKTGNWADFLFISANKLIKHSEYRGKIATMQRVPLLDGDDFGHWHRDLAELLQTFKQKRRP